MKEKIKDIVRKAGSYPVAKALWDLLLVYAVYMVCRLAFVLENYSLITEGGDPNWSSILFGGTLFDISAILYTNLLFILLVLFPLHRKENKPMSVVGRWVYFVMNSLAVIANMADCIYFQYTQRRTTVAVFSEFGNETNLLKIFGVELLNHWYLALLTAALIFALWKFYRNPIYRVKGESLKRYYGTRLVLLVVLVPLMICGMRGYWFHQSSRPLAVNSAFQYGPTPAQAGAVLNTPFTIWRTAWSRRAARIPAFYDDRKLRQLYSNKHLPADSIRMERKNVVIIIVESFAEEFIGARNKDLDGGKYKGYTTFADSLLSVSTTFEHTYCNGWVSIDAMPAVLASLPKMSVSFVTGPYSQNEIPGIAKYLGRVGYHTAFFHGGINSSMGFQAFARAAGFSEYFGMDEYCADSRFDGKKDFDGTWGIWDEEFLQFFCKKISEMPQPFLASVFTLSSHHPFKIPARYADRFKDEGLFPLHKCIRYTDNALRQFFNAARRQPWFGNTIFVITADHASSKVTHDVYKTELGHFRVPIIIYDPSGGLEPGTRKGVMQHIDVMPTLLGLLGYEHPYTSFGKDALKQSDGGWAMNFHNIPQYITDQYLLQLNPDFSLKAVYDYKSDPLLKNNLKGKVKTQGDMESHLKAILQTYQERMTANDLMK